MYIPGNDETSRMLRRTLMRYANLSLILVLRSISIAVKRRFPTRDHLIEAGFISKLELDIFSSVPSNEFNTFWIPCTWFVSLLREARQDCRITDGCGLKIIMEVRFTWFIRFIQTFVTIFLLFNNCIGIERVPKQMRPSLELRLGFYTIGLYTGKLFNLK